MLLEALAAQYTETHASILRWSWKLFCRKWCRMLESAAADQRRKRRRKRREREQREMADLQRAHREHGGGW